MAKLLIVDDEKSIRESLVTFFQLRGHQVSDAESGIQATAILRRDQFALVLTDLRMAEMNGLELLREIQRVDPTTIVILMTAYGTIENAVTAIKEGAYDYVTKPFTLDQIETVVERALKFRNVQLENRSLRDVIDETPLLESKNPTMRKLLETARQAALSDATILLTGESGTGKNLLARQIHRWSRRRDRAFVVVNCTTFSEELLESELFGHIRGAFTGAIKDKPGRLEAANAGTVFLDEVADLSHRLQTKFLRFVQEQSFERVGGDRTIEVDTRIIAASNVDLAAEVRERRFRQDLYYRLNVIALHIPPLRERIEDLPALTDAILKSASIRNQRPKMGLSPGAQLVIRNYSWPGNIRELRNSIERAVVLARGKEIVAEDLPDGVFRSESSIQKSDSVSLENLEREHIIRVMASSATLEEAAATLGINATTLWRKRRRFQID